MTDRLAIMDYGIGGLDLFKRIKSRYPEIGITYFSDSGEIPYGKLSRQLLFNRVSEVISFLRMNGCKSVIVACHSASSVAQFIEDEHIITMIAYTKSSITNSVRSIGIIGGGRTIRSGIYSTYFNSQGYRVKQRFAQPLSIYIERGETDSADVTKAIHKILKPIKDIDALLLACTHYPVLKDQISNCLGKQCLIIDPMDKMFHDLENKLQLYESGQDIFYTSGYKGLMIQAAEAAYGLGLENVVELQKDFRRRSEQ